MSKTRTLFPGAMGPEGFISCFDHLLPDAQLRRRLILKGGPGMGKSTFMRRLYAALCPQQEAATLCCCSGDPDSLDALVVEAYGLIVLDGTAPHIADPVIPGARDSLINLGVCLNEADVRPRLPHIRTCMQEHHLCTLRAQAHMQAAAALMRDNAHVFETLSQPEHLRRITHALIRALLARESPSDPLPGIRPVITDALTCKGELCLIPENTAGRVIRLTAHEGMDLTDVLKDVSLAVRTAGFSVWEHLNPATPGGLLHLTIPALDTLVTTSNRLPAEQLYDFAVCIPSGGLLRYERMIEQGLSSVRLHTAQAASALAQAKQLHDDLEAFYTPSMDFTRWQQLYNETLNSLVQP